MNNIRDRILNDEFSDFHIHSVFSDGCATIEEIVQYAGKLWMKEIAITDHDDVAIERLEEICHIKPAWGARYALRNRENVHNNVIVHFWVEWDVLNESWECCFTCQWGELDDQFIILSVHKNNYDSDLSSVTKGFLNAIEQFHDKIDCIWHPYDVNQLGGFIDIRALVDIANSYDIPLEFNRWTFDKWRAIEDKLLYMLNNAKKIYVNSDAHSLASIKPLRKSCYEFIESL